MLSLVDFDEHLGRLPDGGVCADHCEDESLKDWIAAHATHSTCNYCDRTADNPFAADSNEFAAHVFRSLLLEYGGADDEAIPYETAEGGYQAPTLETWDILLDEGVANEDPLLSDLSNAWHGHIWVRRDIWTLSEDEALVYGWKRFREIVLHERRYWFQLAPSDEYEPSAIAPRHMLSEVGRAIETAGLLRRVPAGYPVFRAHTHHPHEQLLGASRLGAPPSACAASNRMSPAGISIFYGAEDPHTAIAEVRAAETDPTRTALTVAEFALRRPGLLVDLCDVPEVPGLFDEAMAHARGAIVFLRGFAGDVSGPVRRDGREHVDYVPTQVLAEWLRYEFKPAGCAIDGVRYRSAQGPGVCVALFFGHGSALDIDEQAETDWPLQLGQWTQA